jgi:hypothetical protein
LQITLKSWIYPFFNKKFHFFFLFFYPLYEYLIRFTIRQHAITKTPFTTSNFQKIPLFIYNPDFQNFPFSDVTRTNLTTRYYSHKQGNNIYYQNKETQVTSTYKLLKLFSAAKNYSIIVLFMLILVGNQLFNQNKKSRIFVAPHTK